MRYTFFSIIFLLIPTIISAQQNNLITVKGKVIDEKTGAPLEYVNVFLANTTIGTTTGENGNFIINNVPFGSYEIIFAYVGYETEKRSFYSYKPGMFNYNISIKPKDINLNQVTVTGTIPEDWKENLEIFRKAFVGETENSKKTRILNPEVLNFVRDKSGSILKAYSDSVIRVENNALGYMLYIFLDSLVYNIPDGTIKYKIYPRFNELSPASEVEKLTWEDNRQKTYIVSPKHFFYSLVHKQLDMDHYFLLKGSLQDFLNGIVGIVRRLSPEDLNLTMNNDSTLYTFNFTGCLEVGNHWSLPSYLNFLYPSVSIDKYGNLLRSTYIVDTYGYWANHRIADLLPQNYVYLGN
jgi:hypothetical protein